MTIIATEIDPIVVRASYSSFHQKIDNYDFLYRLGFGSYGYMTAAVALIPILVYLYKIQEKVLLPKVMYITKSIFYSFCPFPCSNFCQYFSCISSINYLLCRRKENKKKHFFFTHHCLDFLLNASKLLY
jgi:hypothetical protein